jgi:hypothetical protein
VKEKASNICIQIDNIGTEAGMFQSHWEIIQKVQESHQQDLMREAQQMHLYKEALQRNRISNPVTWRLFRWAGAQMVSIGSAMQQHYAKLAGISSDLQSNLPCNEPCEG